MEASALAQKNIQQFDLDGFQTELQKELNRLYEKQNYPKKQEMEQIVEKHNTTFKKVSNWFKQKRRRQFLKGKLKKQNYKKNWFSCEQVIFLKKKFAENMHPTNQEYLELGKKVKTTEKHIKNWFSHQRQKLAKISTEQQPINQSESTPQNGQQNYALLQQILLNMPLAQRLQLVLGNGINQQIYQNQMVNQWMNQINNQAMLLKYLQTQQQINFIASYFQNIQKSQELTPTSTIYNNPYYQSINNAQPIKSNLSFITKTEQ